MLEDKDVEAVTISVPHYLHSSFAIEAAKAGKHISMEKPLCKTLEEADAILRAVENAKVHDLYMENLCFAPAYALAKDIVDRGGLGDVYLCKGLESFDLGFGTKEETDIIEGRAQISWYLDYSKTGGGQLMSTGCHPIQYVRYVFGQIPAKRVHAEIIEQIGSAKPKGIEDMALVTIRFQDNKVGEIETSFYSTGGLEDKAEIYGNRGTILLDLYKRNPIVVHSQVGYGMLGQSYFSSGSMTDKGWAFPVPSENYALGYYHELRHFLQSIIEDKRPRVNFDDGRATLEIIKAAYESHRTGKVVSLPFA
jgi:predicted dehydrogenase